VSIPSPTIRVQAHDFDLQAEVDALSGGRTDIGAIVSFVGLCRSEQGKLSALELEHYPGMAEMEMKRIADLAIERFSLMGATAIHRHGRIEPGQNIVLVIAAAPHRQAAFDGANFIMDYLKTSAPFWKKEHATDGTAGAWIEAKGIDDQAKNKWD